MRQLPARAVVAAVVAAGALVPAVAFARGGKPLPGKVVATPPPSAPCAVINGFKPSGGFRPSSNNSVGAVWVSFDVHNCGTADNALTVSVVETVAGRPDLTWAWSPSVLVGANKTVSTKNLDNDVAPLGVTYDVSLSVSDASGTVLASRSATVSTPTGA